MAPLDEMAFPTLSPSGGSFAPGVERRVVGQRLRFQCDRVHCVTGPLNAWKGPRFGTVLDSAIVRAVFYTFIWPSWGVFSVTILVPTATTGISRNIKNKLQNVERMRSWAVGIMTFLSLISVFETWAHVASSI